MENDENPKKIERKPKLVVVMGASGSGKSRLAIDLASHFSVEIINADSMQVYEGLDVLTNKVPFEDQKGVAHHLLGSISPSVEFTSKDFRDSAIPRHPATGSLFEALKELLMRQAFTSPESVNSEAGSEALVSPYLLDDSAEDMDESCWCDLPGDKQPDFKFDLGGDGFNVSYDRLKELDPVAANRIHPNDHRKDYIGRDETTHGSAACSTSEWTEASASLERVVFGGSLVNHYLTSYARSGVLPSRLFRGKASEKWGRVDNFRYNCCFICVDASLRVLDRYVEQRVDCMINAGLLNEVFDIYNLNADYTRGLRQAIGVREFEDFLRVYLSNTGTSCFHIEDRDYDSSAIESIPMSKNKDDKMLIDNLREILDSSNESKHKTLLSEAIDKLKANTRRLVRRQKRRLNRLQALFGWDMHYVDATEALLSNSDDSWAKQVVEPSVNIIRSFLSEDASSVPDSETLNGMEGDKLIQRDLWTRYVCEACGNQILRGAHEWEQHKQGRGHRKRILRLKKSRSSCLVEQQQACSK
ncbi:hypothetical protein HHK36_011335 [Tetracentron sinense]|uniref:tRNA isopentenyltransferase n=1 Tax=Tetracentron sinense TaxID=13715 RepID=A0A835DKB7_TETSI|nr:hypothetical protein HHK36_011335 [Tetracentron sinense]